MSLDLLPAIDEPLAAGRGLRPANPVILRDFKKHLREDAALVKAGILDFKSFVLGYRPMYNPVEVVVRGACTHKHPSDPNFRCQNPNGKLKAVRRTHNLRTTQGRDNWQRLAMFGDITASATSFTGVTGTSTATSSNSLTNSGASFPTSGGVNGSLQGHIVWCGAVYGVILSNTATVLTIDQWYNPASASGAAGSTPGATTAYIITPSAGRAIWIGLSTDSTTPAAGDVCRTADGLFGTGGSSSTASEQTANGLARAFVPPTFPGAGQVQLQNTWTYTGSGSVTINKVVCCNSLAAAGTLLFLDTLLSASATVATNGDTIQVTWTVNL